MKIQNIKAVMYKQIHDTYRNKIFLLLIFMYPLLAFLFNYLLEDVENASNMVVPIFITMHIIMAPIVCMSSTISEEKEKSTLKELFFAGVTGYEYLFGVAFILFIAVIISLLPYLLILDFSAGQTAEFILFSAIGSICSLLLGSVIGICAKNQMSVGTVSSPISMLIGLLPMASLFNESIDKISSILYSKRVYDAVYELMASDVIDVKESILVCCSNMVVLIVLFGIAYRAAGKLKK